MKWEAADLRAGIIVVAAVGIAAWSTIWLRRSEVVTGDEYFAEFDRIEGIGLQAPVQLQGYTVGRVAEITPRVTQDGRITFRLRFMVDEVEGVRLPVLAGTKARVQPPAVMIGTPVIVLEPPARGGAALPVGSTLPSLPTNAMMDQIQKLVNDAGGDVKKALSRTVLLLDSLTSTLTVVKRAAANGSSVAESLQVTLPRVAHSAESAIGHADSLLREFRTITPQTKRMLDSLQAVVASAGAATRSAAGTLKDSDPQIRRIIANLDSVSVTMKVLTRELSRKPVKFFSGVPEAADPVPPVKKP